VVSSRISFQASTPPVGVHRQKSTRILITVPRSDSLFFVFFGQLNIISPLFCGTLFKSGVRTPSCPFFRVKSVSPSPYRKLYGALGETFFFLFFFSFFSFLGVLTILVSCSFLFRFPFVTYLQLGYFRRCERKLFVFLHIPGTSPGFDPDSR